LAGPRLAPVLRLRGGVACPPPRSWCLLGCALLQPWEALPHRCSMLQGIWNFTKRHRKKLIFTGLCAGGAYYAWKVYLPRLQQQLLEKLLKESGDLKELLELARGEGAQGGAAADGGGTGDGGEAEKRERFAHARQVSDAFVRKALAALTERHMGCFAVEACTEKVKTAQTKEEKLERFLELLVECLARMVSALYTLHALLLIHRVEFNIVGREVAASKGAVGAGGADGDVYAAFLDTTRYLKEQGVQHVAEAVRSAVRKCLEAAQLGPSTPVTAEALEQLLKDACREADAELLAEARSVSTLLPESMDSEVAEAHRGPAKKLLDEARDYLESPQFVQVFQAVTAKAAQRLAARLGDGAADPAAAPLAEGRSCPLAKLNGQFIKLSESLLDSEGDGGNDFITSFAEEPMVNQLCEALYFQDAASAAGSLLTSP